MVKFVPSVAYLLCLAQPGSFLAMFAHHFVHLSQSLSGYPGHRANSQTKPKYNLAEAARGGVVTVGSFGRIPISVGRSVGPPRSTASALSGREGGRRCFGSFNQHLEPCFTNSPPPSNSGREERERAAGLGGRRTAERSAAEQVDTESQVV